MAAAATEQAGGQQRADPAFRVHDILKEHAAGFVAAHPRAACPQVQSTLAKISMCRTGVLGGSWHWCAACETGIRIPNSCGDRHCPQCRGAQRPTWVDRMQPLLLPDVDYYQVVFTIPADLSSLTLGNRRAMFNLLFHAAWQSLKQVLEDEQAYEAAAAMVLHTWNQHLESHVHLHAVVPGAGPSLRTPGTWKTAKPPAHENQRRWWLVDADNLRREFRDAFLKGLRRLHAKNELRLDGDWLHLQNSAAFDNYVATFEKQTWVAYIEPPPSASSQPIDMVKYLARYLTGGPVSDYRVVAYDGLRVTFTARTGTTHGGSDDIEEVELSAPEFVRRWSLHVLPKGFTKSRRFGGWSNYHCERYVRDGHELSGHSAAPADGPGDVLEEIPADSEPDRMQGRRCPLCGEELESLERVYRTSWRDVFADQRSCPAWYRPRGRSA